MVAEQIPLTTANNGPNNGTVPAMQQPAPSVAAASSAATTVNNEENANEIPVSQLTAFDLAFDELQRTIEEASAVRLSENVRPQLLRSHISALQEDTDLLASFETTSDDQRVKSTQLVLRARRLKRHLERDIIDMDIGEGEQSTQQFVQLVPVDDRKTSNMKLTPLKPPTFQGDASQFRVFRDFFEENVLHNDHLTDTAKWLRLAESLAGQPAELISEIPRTSHTLTVAWHLLLDIYGSDDRPIVELYERLQRLPKSTGNTTDLRMTHSKLEGILLSLEHLGHDVNDNRYVRWIYVNKFPSEIAYQVQKSKNVTLQELRSSIKELLRARESVDESMGAAVPAVASRSSVVKPSNIPQPERKRPTPSANGVTPPCPLRCIFCDGGHWNDVCTAYPSLEARRDRLTGKCFICLRKQHTGAPCITQRRCFHCDSFDHNRALCPTKFQEPLPRPAVQAAIVHDETPTQPTGFFLTFVTEASSDFTDEPIQLRVVVDTAGGSTVMRKEAVQKLRIPVSKASTAYTGLGDAKLVSSYKLQGTVQLQPAQGPPIQMQAEMVEWIIPDVPTADVNAFRQLHPQYDNIAIPPTGNGDPIDLLIGSDMLTELLLPEKIIAVDENTFLMPTKFGSLILGRTRRQQQQVCHHSLLFNILKNPMEHMSNLDLVGLTGLQKSTIEEEQKAIQNFYETVRFLEGRYSISWPWRFYPPLLDSNFGLALGRLKSLYRRLKNHPQLLMDYHNIIQTQLKEGIIEKVDFRQPKPHLTHYVSHHPVLQPGKSTSVRPVYDGSAKSSSAKKSLNDNILKGKNWLTDLVATLIRFRKFMNVATADIAKAFHQIAINEDDRDVVRFIWLKDPTKPPEDDNLQVYRFRRVAFGIVASPFILSATIKHHANQQKPNPFLDTLLNNLYADNLVVALEYRTNITEFYDYAKQFFSSMSMNLTKWSSNNADLLKHIPIQDQIPELIQPVLGLQWDRQADTLSIKLPRSQIDKIPTRRTVAREMATYYDPLGWAAPILLLAKKFFRKVWTQTERWDEPLTLDCRTEWADIINKLREIPQIKLPRHVGLSSNDDKIQLHAFVDASAIAYAVVVYMRIQSATEVKIKIVAARSRLTPSKTVTIPKLELIAILLGTRYVTFVKKSLQLSANIDTFVWSDSKCALSWMKQDKILPTIIDNYVTEAKTYGVNEYRYVPSECNAADVATRGAEFVILQATHWWDGPTWLRNEECWPPKELYTNAENKVSLVFQNKLMTRIETVQESDIDGIASLKIRDFSSLTQLLIRTAYLLKAVTKLTKKNFLKLQADIDVAAAEKMWLRWDQGREYRLQNEPEAGKQILLRNISMFRDEDGLIRCTTRITNSTMDLDTISPLLLVKNSTFTQLLILHTHLIHKHAGTNHTLANIRKKYWLPHGRKQVYKTILNKCYSCRKQISNTYPNPPPAPLPEFRVTRSQKPFQVVGVDIFGPFAVRHAESTGYVKQKRWVIIFTCSAIRAVHLEVINEMTTNEISHAFRRFISRRGVPRKFVSDNAPQFHALDGYFHSIWHTVAKTPAISHYFAQHQITWEFITEFAPWMGGLYERLIKSVKVAFEKTYGTKTLVSRQFETAMVEIEAMLNARPISYVDQDPEMHILTPNNFLMAEFVAIPIKNETQQDDDNIKKLWRSSQAYLDEFWKLWADQYLLLLRERCDQLPFRRHTAKYEPSKGDIVVMQEVGRKRSEWQIAVVERLIPGTDGKTRSVQIRIPNGSRLIRPVISLAPLGMQMDLPNVNDQQLTKRRDALIVWPREGASQTYQNSDQAQLADVEEDWNEEGNHPARVTPLAGSVVDGATRSS